MRPPLQTNALQQHEINRQHHQQQQQQQQQLHQLQTQISTASILPPSTAGPPTVPVVVDTHTRHQQQHQSKLQTRDLFVENHLNLALAGTTTANAGTKISTSLLEQQHEQFVCLSQQQQQQQKQLQSSDGNQLVAINQRHLRAKKLPPPPPPARRIAPAPTNSTVQQIHSTPNSETTKRYSLSSQYSRSSSSDDASSSSLSCNSRANTYDDAAEHFIINFPADSPEVHQRFQHSTDSSSLLNLPLSETEPLLTNIEATVKDTKRSICLNKNSGASLVFTKKELHTTPQHNANNNQRRATLATATPQSWQTRSWKTTSLSLASTGQQKKTKHLPATYNRQQPQRRSLQLNYNNNLVTTTACGGGNNNYCCGSAGLASDQHHHFSIATGKCNRGGGKVVLHKQHTGQNTGSGNTAVFGTGASNNKTAATTRKQHAYSWYAPVYSALEEELEQDSRDSSPIHNLAQTKQKLNTINHYQQRAAFKPSSLSQTENETVALLETRNQINIQQAQLAAHDKRDSSSQSQPPTQQQRRKSSTQPGNKQKDQKLQNGVGGGGGNHRGSSDLGQLPTNIDDSGPLAGSLGLGRGPIPPRKRLQNIVKSWVGLKSTTTTTTPTTTTTSSNDAQTNNNSNSVGNISATAAMVASTVPPNTLALSLPQRPTSPEITITRTPSEQNLVILREPTARCTRNKKQQLRSNDKLAYLSTQAGHEGSTSSLNVVQQKLWNIVRREHSATSLHQEKSQSIVQYTAGMRKCETVLALTRQAASPTNTTMGNLHDYQRSTSSMHYTGSGIFNANGVEQIRPLNRVRNSVTSINGAGGGNATAATCSRCSSLLSLAATGSRCSLNFNKHIEHGLSTSASQQQLQQLQYIPAKIGKHQRDFRDAAQEQQGQQPLQQTRHSSLVSNNSSNICFNAYTRLDSDEQTPPPSRHATKPRISLNSSGSDMVKIQVGGKNYFSNTNSPSNVKTTATILYAKAKPMSTPTTPSIPTPTSTVNNFAECLTQQLTNAASKAKDYPLSASTALLTVPTTPPAAATILNQDLVDGTLAANDVSAADSLAETSESLKLTNNNNGDDDGVIEMQPFEPFTCKLCLIDVDTAPEATTLQECGCRFCTECMKAYVEFEISEAAYEISCPDAQCPTQGIMTLAEIASLTTANLMKKHHRYRLNKEIELDKSRTWCPRAGCETICHVGPHHQNDATPSTSTHKAAIVNSNGRTDSASPITATIAALNNKGTVLWAVQCPTCKDEFCSACKKTWHPNISCEEHSRRLVADGHDDIGIPFDNDLIKCCPMCAVPIEKDEGCAQMMCKRCKHVFCWYCLASLDDDFLLRHYDKGPCKNKLGHSRASVVWHRAQVIGIFAGFGILLLVASPLLLLAAPCIICCKCRSCSGSKIDDGDDELDEATALQSS